MKQTTKITPPPPGATVLNGTLNWNYLSRKNRQQGVMRLYPDAAALKVLYAHGWIAGETEHAYVVHRTVPNCWHLWHVKGHDETHLFYVNGGKPALHISSSDWRMAKVNNPSHRVPVSRKCKFYLMPDGSIIVPMTRNVYFGADTVPFMENAERQKQWWKDKVVWDRQAAKQRPVRVAPLQEGMDHISDILKASTRQQYINSLQLPETYATASFINQPDGPQFFFGIREGAQPLYTTPAYDGQSAVAWVCRKYRVITQDRGPPYSPDLHWEELYLAR